MDGALLLGGPMGAGKSTVGALVARGAGVPFVDLDVAVAARAGKSLTRLFAEDGEGAFRALEEAELRRLLDEPGPRVIALGGGTLVDPELRRAALLRARVVTLTARAETLAARTGGDGRPLLDGEVDRTARLRRLLEERASAYAEVHHSLATDEAPPAALAARVLDAWSEPAVAVALGARSYSVRVTDRPAQRVAEALAELRPTGVFVVTDETVAALWGEPLAEALRARGLGPACTVAVPPGEASKQLGWLERVLGRFVEAGADRGAVVVTLGGGVVSDLGGFAAATLLRGVRWVAVPTTMLAMVDASVGGKTGVDVGSAKNAAGAFHQPSAVVLGPLYTATETPRAYASGLAEAVKAACVGDPGLFELLEGRAPDVLARSPGVVAEVALRAVGVKAGIVSRDERESGERAHLNFGHTLGHALEAEGRFERLTHGEAVALGMVGMLRVGTALGITPVATAARVSGLLAELGLPTDLSSQPLQGALPWLRLDKKRRGDTLDVVLLRSLGMPLRHAISVEALTGALVAAGSPG